MEDRKVDRKSDTDAQILESPQDAVLQEDLELLLKEGTVPFERLKDKTVFVTGATGLLGSQVIKALLCSNRVLGTNIRILAFVRNEQKAKRVFAGLLARDDLQLVYGDVSKVPVCEQKVDYIIHGASATSSRYFVSNPVETIMTAVNGTVNMLEFARAKQAEGFLYLSSLEVYGTPSADAGLIGESYSGYIDPLSVRSSYSEGKRMVECICASYTSQYQVPVKIARLSQTFGAGVEYDDGRVFAEFARCALEKKDIVLHTKGQTVRSYCYTKDAVAAMLLLLLKGEPGTAYNVTNMETKISIADMAQLVCDTFPQAGIHVTFDMPKDVASFGYNPEMVIALDSGRLQALGWKPTVGLKEMFTRLAASMKPGSTAEWR
ncbi:MAG: NAD-dependent epimerase/dehydratase family protein [Eubacterium sp.]|nr:NAD-dependent epimerase/dehydratase family protein [Eubacterium sp.]